MITTAQILHLIPQGETTIVQFKIRAGDTYKKGAEIGAFSNAHVGMLIVDVVNNKTS